MADRTVVYRLQADITQFRAQMVAAGASVKGAADAMTGATREGDRYRRGLTGLGATAGKVGLVAAAGLGSAIMAAANFDQSMSNVQAATHETAGNMELLRAAAIKAGADTVYSAGEAAGAIEELAKAGVSTKDILAGGLSGALNLAAAGQLDVAKAAELSATAMTQFKLTGDQIPHVADLLSAAANKAQGSVEDMGMALKQGGLVAAQTGLSIEETTGTLAAFASAGLLGSDAGTSLKQMLLSLTPSSSKAKELMDQLGISAYDAQGKFIGMAAFAENLRSSLAGMSDEQKNATLKTIFGSDAVRAASIVYQQGSSGIQGWIDKTNDAGNAAETAALRMDNLKGDLEQLRGSLETALIGQGEGAQAPLRSLIQNLTELVNAYNALPAPVKGAINTLGGFVAVAGGGLWVFSKMVNGVSGLRASLEQLGWTAQDSEKKLLSLRNVARVGAALGTVALASTDLDEKAGVANTSMYALYGTMILPGWGTAIGLLVGGFRDFAAANDGATKAIDTLNTALGDLNGQPASSEQLADLEAKAAAAKKALEDLGVEVKGGGAFGGAGFGGAKNFVEGMFGSNDVEEATAAYHRAIAALEKARGASVGNTSATQDAGKAAEVTASHISHMTEALKKQRQSARDSASEFVNLGDKLDKAKVSLDDWIKHFHAQAEALRNFRVNAQNAAKKGLDEGLIKSLQEAGPEGALRMKQLANATKEQIAKANSAWRDGQREVARYTDFIAGVPNSVVTHVQAENRQALAAIMVVRARLAELQDKQIHVDVVRTEHTGVDYISGGQRHADGGTVYGQRYPYGDKVLSWLAPGEEVISNRHGQADRFRRDRAAGRIPHYADGGTVAHTKGDGNPQMRGAQHAIDGFTHRLKLASAALDKERKQRDALVQKAQQLSSGIKDSFTSDFWGRDASSAWMGGGGGWQAALLSDISGAKSFNKALHQLRSKGVSGGAFSAIAASGNLLEAQQMAGLSRNQLAQYERLYRERQRVAARAGSFAGEAVYGHKLDISNRHLSHLQKEVAGLRHEQHQAKQHLAHMRKEAAKHAKDTGKAAGKAAGDAVSHAGAKGKRKAKSW